MRTYMTRQIQIKSYMTDRWRKRDRQKCREIAVDRDIFFAGVIFNRFVKPLTAVVKSVRYTALPVYVPTTWQPVGKSDWGQLRNFSAEFLDAFTGIHLNNSSFQDTFDDLIWTSLRMFPRVKNLSSNYFPSPSVLYPSSFPHVETLSIRIPLVYSDGSRPVGAINLSPVFPNVSKLVLEPTEEDECGEDPGWTRQSLPQPFSLLWDRPLDQLEIWLHKLILPPGEKWRESEEFAQFQRVGECQCYDYEKEMFGPDGAEMNNALSGISLRDLGLIKITGQIKNVEVHVDSSMTWNTRSKFDTVVDLFKQLELSGAECIVTRLHVPPPTQMFHQIGQIQHELEDPSWPTSDEMTGNWSPGWLFHFVTPSANDVSLYNRALARLCPNSSRLTTVQMIDNYVRDAKDCTMICETEVRRTRSENGIETILEEAPAVIGRAEYIRLGQKVVEAALEFRTDRALVDRCLFYVDFQEIRDNQDNGTISDRIVPLELVEGDIEDM